jgi:hypothetical protein
MGDLVGLSSNTLVKASDTAWDTDLATTQTNFAALFLGFSNCDKLADVARVVGQPNNNEITVNVSGCIEYDAAPGTYTIGAFVGPAKQSGNALEDQKVVPVDSLTKAIGISQTTGTNPSKCVVLILSKLMPTAR